MSDKIKTITLPVSGAVVKYRRPPVSKSKLIANFTNNYPKPAAPTMEVKILNKPERIENFSDPNYLDEVKMWSNLLMIRVDSALTKMAVIPPDKEALAKEVAYFRELLPDETAGQQDLEIWIDLVICQDDEDYKALSRAIAETMGATEEQISEKQATFPSNSKRRGRIRVSNGRK